MIKKTEMKKKITLKTRGRTFRCVVVSSKANKSAVVEWNRIKKIPKYERIEKLKSRLQVHNPTDINAVEGDFVEIQECRPISKTKSFIITKIIDNKNKEIEETKT